MTRSRVTATIACLTLLLAGGVVVRARPGRQAAAPPDQQAASPAGQQAGAPPGHLVPAEADPKAIGAVGCAECHLDKHRTWSSARHSKMLQPASSNTVLGDFSLATVTLRGVPYALERDADQFAIRGPVLGPREERYRIDYTLGSRRVQHYLATLPDGRIVVLPPTWDVERAEWFHNLDIVRPDEAVRQPVQVWNQHCAGCHVSASVKRYDAARDTYATAWTDFGTGCERCHGPGAAHAARYTGKPLAPGGTTAIVVPSRLSPERSTGVCAQCHSLRDMTVPGYTAGEDYDDYFTPVLEYGDASRQDPAYWADGRPRRFSNDAIGLWQSRCYLDGNATCITCHVDPHEPDIDRNPRLQSASNQICAGCHAPIAEDPARHTKHAPGSPASACVSCHMPRTVVSLRHRMPDHTLSVPAPESTVRHGIPNACTECHADRPATWAVEVLASWYPGGRRQSLVRRADAFSLARQGVPAALPQLLAIVRDAREPPLVRANAVGYLRRFPGQATYDALRESAASSHAAVRNAAVLGLGESGFPLDRIQPVLVAALADSKRVVRVSAALALTNLQVVSLSGEDGRRLAGARRDYLARASMLSDDARVLLDAGKFQLLAREVASAIRTLEASLRLDPGLQAARYFLGLALVADARIVEGRAVLGRIPPDDPYAVAAAKVLAGLPGR